MSELHAAAIADLQGDVLTLRSLVSALTGTLIIEGNLSEASLDVIGQSVRSTIAVANFRNEERRAAEYGLLDDWIARNKEYFGKRG